MAEIKKIGVVSTFEWLNATRRLVESQGFNVMTANVESIIGESSSNSEVNRWVLNLMTEGGVDGILAEYTGGELLKKEFMRVGGEVPMVVMMDWVNDRSRRDAREMKESGLVVVRYDLAKISGKDEVVTKALELLEVKMRSVKTSLET